MTNATAESSVESNTSAHEATAREAILLLLAAFALFAAIAPTLRWLEFASGGENLLVATALESERTGNWLMPTLNAEPRIAKPPLPTWIAGASITSQTAVDLGSSDAQIRAKARAKLAWQARWPFLLCACLLALAAFELGRVLTGDRAVAWAAVAVCATSILVLRAARAATTDITLAMFVALANLCIAHAIMKNRLWLGAIGGGLAMGLGMMSKGPVVFLQTALPALVFVLWRAWAPDRERSNASTRRGIIVFAVFACLLAVIATGLPWYLAVWIDNPQVIDRWRVEVLREGATGLKPGHWYNYVAFLPMMTPWMVFFLTGCALIIGAVASKLRATPSGAAFALLMVLVPIVAMSFFRDRKERYLLPMATPAAVVAGIGVAALRRNIAATRRDDAIEAVHWCILAAAAIGIPIAGGVALKAVDGTPWYTKTECAVAAVTGGVIAAGLIVWSRRSRARTVLATAALMLAVQTFFIWGYRNSREGRSEMKPLADLIWSRIPDARVITTGDKRLAPLDLAIYLNRPVVWVDNPNHGPVSPGRQVLVINQDDDEFDPPAPPAGWTHLARFARDNDWWHAFASP